jgi:hypothetical protein
MTLVCADIPDNAADLPTWLERQLVGGRLAELVAELTAANGPGDSRVTLADLLKPHTEAVRTAGLVKLPGDTLRELLRQPRLLLELQEWALIEGGPYWQHLLDTVPADPAVARGATRLDEFLTGTVRPAADPQPPRPRLAWYQQPWLVSLATAACVLAAVYAVRVAFPTPPVEKGNGTVEPPPVLAWGWDKPGVLKQDVPAREYLGNLARAAEEWSKQRPETAQALARRLNEFRAGCSTLILTKHEPLNERDRIWLKDRCIEWAEEITKSLAKLEEDGQIQAVRDETDKLVEKIAKSLKDRAAKA